MVSLKNWQKCFSLKYLVPPSKCRLPTPNLNPARRSDLFYCMHARVSRYAIQTIWCNANKVYVILEAPLKSRVARCRLGISFLVLFGSKKMCRGSGAIFWFWLAGSRWEGRRLPNTKCAPTQGHHTLFGHVSRKYSVNSFDSSSFIIRWTNKTSCRVCILTLDRATNENNHPLANVTAQCFETIVHCFWHPIRDRWHDMGCTVPCKKEKPKRLMGSSTKKHTGRAQWLIMMNTCYLFADWVLLNLWIYYQ